MKVAIFGSTGFEGKYILNTMGLSKVPIKDKTVYTQNIHRDVRSFTGSSKLELSKKANFCLNSSLVE